MPVSHRDSCYESLLTILGLPCTGIPYVTVFPVRSPTCNLIPCTDSVPDQLFGACGQQPCFFGFAASPFSG